MSGRHGTGDITNRGEPFCICRKYGSEHNDNDEINNDAAVGDETEIAMSVGLYNVGAIRPQYVSVTQVMFASTESQYAVMIGFDEYVVEYAVE